MRELALAAPGTDAKLAEQVARIVSRPLDRARPLWELYLIQGLESGLTAMLTKIHHALIDGMSGAEIMGLLLDLSPEGRELPAATATDPSSPPASLRCSRAACWECRATRFACCARFQRRCRTLAETLFSTLPGAGTVGRLAGRLQGIVRPDGDRVVRSGMRAPRTSFNGRISPPPLRLRAALARPRR